MECMRMALSRSSVGVRGIRSLAVLIAAAGTVMCIAPAAMAQKAAPQPLEPYVEPQLDVGLWSQVYQLTNRPRLLVLCGYGTSRHQAMDPAQVLSNLDSTAVTHKIRAALIGELNVPGADIELVDDNALRSVMTRLKDNLNLSGDLEAGELLKQQLGADQLILVRLVDSGTPGSPFSVIVESSDLARGRVGATFPFDWKGGTDVVNIKANARAVAIKYVNDFALRVNHPVRYTAQVFGTSTVELQRATLEGLNGLSGLRGQVRTRSSGTTKDSITGQGDAYTEYELTFVRGSDADPTQLLGDITQILKTRYNIAVEPRQSEGGRLAFRVAAGKGGISNPTAAPTAAPVATPAEQVATPQEQPIEVERDTSATASELRKLYADRGSPRIVVMINRAATIQEYNDWRSAGSNADTVVVIGSGNTTTQPGKAVEGEQFIDPRSLDLWARQVEQAVSNTLTNEYGLSQQISPDLARASMLASVDNGQRFMGADQLLGMLRKEDVADIAIVGCGKIVSGIAGYEMVYTLETVELATSRRLGAALITAPVQGITGADTVRRSSQSFATRASSQSAESLHQAFGSAQPLELTITGVSSDAEVAAIAEAIRAHGKGLSVSGPSTFRTENATGIATMNVQWAGASDQLGTELQRVLTDAKVPFNVAVTQREGRKVTLAASR
jgi:hypothetical protein